MKTIQKAPGPCQYRPSDYRYAFTVLELMVTVAIIGLLIALLLPAIMYARESARRTTCTSNLREIGIAMHSHHGSHRRLPQAWQVAKQDPDFSYGWAAQLLPELEQQGIRQTFNFRSRPSISTDSSFATLPLFLCPSDLIEPSFELLAGSDHEEGAGHSTSLRSAGESSLERRRLLTLPTASYVGVFGTAEADEFEEFKSAGTGVFADGSVIHDRPVRFADLLRGLSNTLLVGERTMATVPSTWLGVDMRGEDAACRLVGSAMTRPNCSECDECEFTSRHTGGSNFLWADGHVAIISDSVETSVYREFAKRILR